MDVFVALVPAFFLTFPVSLSLFFFNRRAVWYWILLLFIPLNAMADNDNNDTNNNNRWILPFRSKIMLGV